MKFLEAGKGETFMLKKTTEMGSLAQTTSGVDKSQLVPGVQRPEE